MITGNPNYVKKVIFPIHTLGGMVTGSALIHGAMSATILIIAKLILDGNLTNTVLAIPIVWLPLIFGCLGLSWILSWIGVVIKDTPQLINAGVSMMMFLSPIFYPSSALPDKMQWLASMNPLATVIEDTRSVIILGNMPSASKLLIEIFISVLWCQLCFNILKKSQKSLADIL